MGALSLITVCLGFVSVIFAPVKSTFAVFVVDVQIATFEATF